MSTSPPRVFIPPQRPKVGVCKPLSKVCFCRLLPASALNLLDTLVFLVVGLQGLWAKVSRPRASTAATPLIILLSYHASTSTSVSSVEVSCRVTEEPAKGSDPHDVCAPPRPADARPKKDPATIEVRDKDVVPRVLNIAVMRKPGVSTKLGMTLPPRW